MLNTKLIEIARTLEDLAAKYKPPLEVLGEGENRIRITENFGLWEFQCPCCGTVKIDPELVRRLQQARDKLGKPIVITSGYRCPQHNRAIKGASNSQHLYGTAADVKCQGLTARQLYDVLEPLFPDGGVGMYSGHVHVDTRGTRARWTG